MNTSQWFKIEHVVRSAIADLVKSPLQIKTCLWLIDNSIGWERCTFIGSAKTFLTDRHSGHRSIWGLKCTRQGLYLALTWLQEHGIVYRKRLDSVKSRYHLNIPGMLELYIQKLKVQGRDTDAYDAILGNINHMFEKDQLEHPILPFYTEPKVSYQIADKIGKVPPILVKTREKQKAKKKKKPWNVETFMQWFDKQADKRDLGVAWYFNTKRRFKCTFEEGEVEEKRLQAKNRACIKRLLKEVSSKELRKRLLKALDNWVLVAAFLAISSDWQIIEDTRVVFPTFYRYRQYIWIYLEKDMDDYTQGVPYDNFRDWERWWEEDKRDFALFVEAFERRTGTASKDGD